MRLSEAMALGRTIEPPGNPGSFETCALGVGMAAFGVKYGNRAQEAKQRFPWILNRDPEASEYAVALGADDFRGMISSLYFQVNRGLMTFDELIDKVRAIEPAETEQMPAPLNQVLNQVLTLTEQLELK